MSRIFYSTDIHGSEVCYKKFLKAPEFYGADIIILAGDETGKMIIPIVPVEGGYNAYHVEGVELLKDKEELQTYEKNVRDAGYYFVHLSTDEYERIRNDEKAIDELFHKIMLETVEQWVAMAQERLDDHVRFIATPGNDDSFAIDDILKKSTRVIYGEDQVIQLDDEHEMLSLGWSTPTVWNTPRECSEEELAKKIDELAANVKNMETCVFNIHVPPYGTGLDIAPELDGDKLVRGGTVQKSVGSTAVLEAIEKYQPLLGLHGHIHESKASKRIGRTLCINPGSMYGDAVLCGAFIDLGRNKVKNYMIVTG